MIAQRLALLEQTRRHFFSRCFVGLGGIAFGSLLGEETSLLRLETEKKTLSRRGLHTMVPRPSGSSICSWRADPASSRPGSTGPSSHVSMDGRRQTPFLRASGSRSWNASPRPGPSCWVPPGSSEQHGQSGTWVSDVFPSHGDRGRSVVAGALGGSRELQPRPCQTLLQYRIISLRASEYGCLAGLRFGQRIEGSACLRRPPIWVQ